VGGSGGGRPDMAQAGGTQPENIDKALAKVKDLLKGEKKVAKKEKK
jgi:alanyl-tRNA synthetase